MATVLDLGKAVKAKYPGQYNDLSDQDLGTKVRDKYPQYADYRDVRDSGLGDLKQSLGYRATSAVIKDIAKPFASIGATALNLGEGAADITGAGIGKLVGNEKFARTALDKADQDLNRTRDLPFLGQIKPGPGINLNLSKPSDVFSGQNIRNAASAVGTGLEAGTTIAAFEPGTGAVKDIAEKGLKEFVKPGLKTLAKEGLKEGLIYGAPASLGNALQKENATPSSVVSDTIIGTGLSGLFGLTLGVGLGATNKVYDFFNPETAKKNLANAFKEALRPTQAQLQAEARYFKDTPGFLAEEAVMGKGISLEGNGGRLDATGAISELGSRYQAENAAFENILKTSGTYNSIDQLEKEWVEAAKEQFKGTEQDWAIKKIQEEIAAYRSQYPGSIVKDANGEDIMPSFEFNKIKKSLWDRAKSSFASPNLDKLADDLFFQGGHVAKDQIENVVTDANIKGLNKRLGDFASAIKLLEKRDGIPLGRLNRYMARLLGSIIGSGGGPVSSFVGALTGDKLAEILQNPEISIGIRSKIYKELQTQGRTTIIDEAQKILEQRSAAIAERKLLPAPSAIYGNEFKGLPESTTSGLSGSFGMQEKAIEQGLPDKFQQPRSQVPDSMNPDIITGQKRIIDLKKPNVIESGANNVSSLKGRKIIPSVLPPQSSITKLPFSNKLFNKLDFLSNRFVENKLSEQELANAIKNFFPDAPEAIAEKIASDVQVIKEGAATMEDPSGAISEYLKKEVAEYEKLATRKLPKLKKT